MRDIKALLGIGGLYQSSLFLVKLTKLYFIGVFLSVEELGEFAIVSIFVFLLESISKTGVGDYLIARKSNAIDNRQWNNAWTLEFIKYAILSAVTFLSSSHFSVLFGLKDDGFLLKVFSLVFLFNAVKNINITRLQKDLRLKKYLAYNLAPIALGLIVTIFLFYKGITIEALVIGIVCQSCGHVILSF